jgi:hypothetical protein
MGPTLLCVEWMADEVDTADRFLKHSIPVIPKGGERLGWGNLGAYFFFAAISLRRRSSFSLSSGVNSAPKSSASNT